MNSIKRSSLFFLFALLIILWAGNIVNLGAQCSGNLGENIFTEGDFGAGSANILLPDPGIAPGYLYQPNPPPNDGFYCIANNTTPWGFFAVNWADIQDNSSDPNGYMMVVNASVEPGLFYEQEVDNLCENTLYVFSADVFNLILSPGAIKPNISFLIDGAVVYQTGDIPENQQWNTYGFTFTTDPGQTSVTLALQNNAPGGGGNDLALDNITFRACGPEALILPETIEYICEDGSPIDLEATINGDQYPTPVVQWQQSFDEGLTWQNIPGETNLVYTHTNLSGGFYYYRYLLANGAPNLLNSKCRVVSNEKIIRVVPKFYSLVDTLCEGLTYTFGAEEIGATGIYTDSLISFSGCDSIVTLNLTILPDPDIQVDFDLQSSCRGTDDGRISINTIRNGTPPYTISINEEPNFTNGNIENLANGEYTYEITDYFGCRLDTTLNLTDPAPLLVDLGRDWQVELGESVEINPFFSEPVENLTWRPAELIDCPAPCDRLVLIPSDSLQIAVTAESTISGCAASDSLRITVVTVRKVYIPNAFTPNFDGINDYFTVFADQPNVQAVEQLLVFDRWGGLVFEGTDLPPNDERSGWDGSATGERVPAGIYVYSAKVRFLDGVVLEYEGDVQVLR